MQSVNKSTRKRKSVPGTAVLIVVVLACVALAVLLLTRPKTVDPSPHDEATAEVTNYTQVDDAIALSEETVPQPGTLLETGTSLNDNYYRKLDYSGMPSDLTDSSFVLGKDHPATVGKTGQDYSGCLTVHFGNDTVIKTALLYYPDDRYEIYMGSISDLIIAPGYSFDVILVDPDATELWAKEIIVSSFVFDS